MMGLGLRGIFIHLNKGDIYMNLKDGIEKQIIGNLLGMAASRDIHSDKLIDISVYKAIFTHLDDLNKSEDKLKFSCEC